MKYFMPTRLFRGKGCLADNAHELILGKRAFIVTGRSSGRLSGALGDAEDILKEAHIPFLVWDKTGNNPTVEECYEAGRVAHDFGADFVVGIGGGSPLDAAKAVAVYASNPDIEPYDIYKGSFAAPLLPMAAIPTTAGTGSEVTQYSVLTNAREETKKSFSAEGSFYTVAFLDGGYLKAVPKQVLKNTAVDAMSHLIESFTNTRSTPMSEYIALEGMRVLGGHIAVLDSGELTDEDRDALLWASTLGGIAIAQTGTTVVHSMGYPLTYFKGIPHGAANGLLLGEYLRHAENVIPEKLGAILSALGFKSLDELDVTVRRLVGNGVTFSEEELDIWAENTVKAKNAVTCPFKADLETEGKIFRNSLLK